MHRIVILIILMGGIVLTLGGALAKTTLYPSEATGRAMAAQSPDGKLSRARP